MAKVAKIAKVAKATRGRRVEASAVYAYILDAPRLCAG